MRAKHRLILVSRRNLYRRCKGGGAGINYRNTAVEPWIAVSPVPPGQGGKPHLIGVYQQGRWSNGGAHGLVAVSSPDGGHRWRLTQLPFSSCARDGLKFGRASDPWVSIGPDGTAYATALSFNVNRKGQVTTNAVVAATSMDGGRTWRNVNLIKLDRNPNFQNDKSSVTADPTKPKVAYAVWDRLTPTTGPTWFAKTADGGRTWGKPRIIFSPGRDNQTIGNQIVADPRTGKLYNFFTWAITKSNSFIPYITVQTSTNRGRTWSRAKIIARQQSVGVTNPNTSAPIRTGGDIIAEPAIDPRNGKLYVVWQDSRFSKGKFDDVAISSSSDGGKTWSRPKRANTPTGKPAFTPMVRVNAAGTVAVTYYDFRRLTKRSKTLPTDYWITFSRDGGHSFHREKHITGPFNMNKAPNTAVTGRFLGDYQGLVAVRRKFRPFFARTIPGTKTIRTGIYTAAVCP